MREKAAAMTPEEIEIADEVMPDVPTIEDAEVVVSWGQETEEFVVSDSV